MTINELQLWLAEKGFKFARYFTREDRNICEWYARRNKIVIKPYSSVYGFEFVDVEVHGQTNGLHWKLVVTRLIPEELTERLPEIDELLVRGADSLRTNT